MQLYCRIYPTVAVKGLMLHLLKPYYSANRMRDTFTSLSHTISFSHSLALSYSLPFSFFFSLLLFPCSSHSICFFNPFAAKAIKHIWAIICHAYTHIHMHAHNHMHTCHISFCRLLEIAIIEIFLHTFVTYIQTNTYTHTHTCIHTNTHTHTVCIR